VVKSKTMNSEYKKLVRRYIRAKDENKPHLMESTFSSDATLSMSVRSDNISFPSEVSGLNEISQTLVREFNNTYENIYTFCLLDTVEPNALNEQIKNTLKCDWLVGMTEKSSGSSRVGCGSYQWHFKNEGACLTSHLNITIEQMLIVSEENQLALLAWLNNLAYPWVHSSDILSSMPNFAALANIRDNM